MTEAWLYLVIDTERWAARTSEAYLPPELSQGTMVSFHGPEDIGPTAQALMDGGKKPVLITLDPNGVRESVQHISDGRVVVVRGLPLAAILRVAPLHPDGRGGFVHRDPTPADHTLYGVLTRIQLGESDQALRWKLDRALGRHVPWLRSRCTDYLFSFPEASLDEVVQEVLLEAWRHLEEGYQPDRAFRVFLAKIALNKCRNLRRKRRDVLMSDHELLEAASEAASVLESMEGAERDRQVLEAVEEALPPLDQEIALLRYVDDLSFEEIARLKGLEDTNAVRVAMQRIKRRLGTVLRRRLVEETR